MSAKWVVHKFRGKVGGTSVADAGRYRSAARTPLDGHGAAPEVTAAGVFSDLPLLVTFPGARQ